MYKDFIALARLVPFLLIFHLYIDIYVVYIDVDVGNIARIYVVKSM